VQGLVDGCEHIGEVLHVAEVVGRHCAFLLGGKRTCSPGQATRRARWRRP
jgi:hypothetical protein